ncbi:hypothetical protein [Cupriavidus basilensis]|uniref:hypothetical protein n=1 Tax=Cupriavidus basilensis TaxID=68895 RepID=UPI0023E894A5|nr:hypothetical protein [Cupriavidus basilensis]MDF3886787.1 hypothetical protein [Cupriavidus basilensis]
MPQHTAPPMDGLMDLLHEVRQFSRDLQKSARRAAPASGPKAYRDTLHALIDCRMQDNDPHGRIVCYASAAELGVPVELPADQCRQAMSGGLGFGLRVLFWAAHRRMIATRPVGNWGGLASHLARPASLKDKATAPVRGASVQETT